MLCTAVCTMLPSNQSFCRRTTRNKKGGLVTVTEYKIVVTMDHASPASTPIKLLQLYHMYMKYTRVTLQLNCDTCLLCQPCLKFMMNSFLSHGLLVLIRQYTSFSLMCHSMQIAFNSYVHVYSFCVVLVYKCKCIIIW